MKKILYNLSIFNQAQRATILISFKKMISHFNAQYANIINEVFDGVYGEDGFVDPQSMSGGYYYLDDKNKSFVHLSTFAYALRLGSDMIFIPVYKIINIYPYEMNDYYYTCLYVDNDPPATVGNVSKWFQKTPSTPITNNYYKFLLDKFRWYRKKYLSNIDDFEQGTTYNGPDYVNYIAKKANEFKKSRKPYKYVYKSPKFIPPEKVPITSSRLLGGKTRPIKVKHTRKMNKKHIRKHTRKHTKKHTRKMNNKTRNKKTRNKKIRYKNKI